ncbi:MAG: PAS domain S-box protein, partial [Planctomycetaceae bacterium]|nr:PAS domain S-box protein [Planctomycetaceae bacterium]
MERRLVESDTKSLTTIYGVAVLCAVGALLLRLPLNTVLEGRVPYITFFLATAISATYGGLGPGLATTFLGALLSALYVVPSTGLLAFSDVGDYLGLGLFVAISSLISYLAGKRLDATRHENALRILFQQTFISIGDAVITTDDEKGIRLMNPVAEQLTGWTQAEAKGHSIDEVFRIFKEGSDVPADFPIDRILETGNVLGLANHTELLSKHGNRIPIDDSGAPIRAANGKVVGAVLVFRDISERRRNERELEALTEELKQFTYAATHDIREPLRTISIFVQLIEAGLKGKVDEQIASHIDRVRDGTQKLNHLVDSLLHFTSIRDAGNEIAPASMIDAEGALAEAKRGLEGAINDSHGVVTNDPLPTVRGNFIHICQIFQNL